jgi:hypothetical protein
MTSTPVTLLSRRSGNSSDRPFPATVQAGELALGFGAAEGGLYFKDSLGAIRKVAGTHYGTTAPNSTPVGQTGNSVGETWVDSSTSAYYLFVWTGGAWQKIGAAFADSALTATTATTATTADSCTGKIATTFTGALPAVGVAGSAAFDTALGIFYVSDGTAWVAI